MFDLVFVLFSLFGEGASVSDLVYAVTSLVQTGTVVEDSILWDCATMGNKVCG